MTQGFVERAGWLSFHVDASGRRDRTRRVATARIGGRSLARQRAKASLNVLSETLLHDLIKAQPSNNLMVEVPSFMASDAAHTAALQALHANGNVLLVKGRPLHELPRDVLPCFKYSIIDVEEERRAPGSSAPPGVTRNIGHVQSGVHTMADMEASFQRGAVAVLGWPIEDALARVAARHRRQGRESASGHVRGGTPRALDGRARSQQR